MLLIQRNLNKLEKQAGKTHGEKRKKKKRYIKFRVHIFHILTLNKVHAIQYSGQNDCGSGEESTFFFFLAPS